MSSLLNGLVPRRLDKVVLARMSQEPVIVLQGPRTVGKSTLLRGLATQLGVAVIDLDDPPTREAVRADPTLFVRGVPSPVMLDEFQHAPVVLDAIKAELNIDPRPGRFIITGSTRYATAPTIAQALTGRAHLVVVRPLSQGEINQVPESFAGILVNDPALLVTSQVSATARDYYAQRAVAGGLPIPLRRETPVERARWFDDYVNLVVERDVLDIARVRQREHLPRLLGQMAAQSGQVLNIARAAAAIGMDKSTAENYTKLLEAVFLIHRLPAWGATLGAGVASAPKVFVVDSGLAARLLRLTEAKLAAASASALAEFGHLLETFVVSEILKQLDWLDEPVVCGHYRTHDGDEVDLIIERSDGGIIAVEVKAGSRVPGEAMRPMMRLGRRLGSQFLGGIVLYTGPRSYTYKSRIHVAPIDRLWTTSQGGRP